jgi:mRNA interferase MazF
LVGRSRSDPQGRDPEDRAGCGAERDGLNRARRTVVIVPLSTGPEPHPPIVVATPSAGEGSVAVCDQLRAVDKVRLTRMAGALSREDLRVVEDAVRAVLQL